MSVLGEVERLARLERETRASGVNTLELVDRMRAKARADGNTERLNAYLMRLAMKLGLTDDEIEKACEPGPFGEMPVVYYP